MKNLITYLKLQKVFFSKGLDKLDEVQVQFL